MSRSSLVSMRSYERRRKSAGARLERAQTPTILTISVTPPTGGQVEDTTTNGEGVTALKVPVRRAMSARDRKREHEASDIFPELETRRVDPEWGVSKYSEDYGPKTVTPVPIRPISPTRKNNPHPAQAFMKWQYPVRIHDHKKAVPPHPDTWRYINESFQEDYTDTYNTGDAKNEVPITNLAKIEFPGKPGKTKKHHTINTGTSTPQLPVPSGVTAGDAKNEFPGKPGKTKKRHTINTNASTPQLPVPSGVSGTKAKLNPRHFSKEYMTTTGQSTKTLRPPSPQSRMMHNTLKVNTLPFFKDWLYKTASPTERDVVLQMLHAVNDDSQEMRMNKALSQVLQGDSAEKVQEWLKHTSESERQVLLRVLETLAFATSDNDIHMQSQSIGTQFMYPNFPGGHHRGHTYPISLQGRHCSSRHHHPHHSRHHKSSRKRSEVKDEGYSSSVFSETHAGFGLVGKKMTTRKSKEEKQTKSEKPVLWQNRILKKHAGATIFHAGGVFGQPQKDKGQHFSIHPEWPTA